MDAKVSAFALQLNQSRGAVGVEPLRVDQSFDVSEFVFILSLFVFINTEFFF